MSWTDLVSIGTIEKLKNIYKIKTAIETGTYTGVNSAVYSQIFDYVITIESASNYYKIAKDRLSKYNNVNIVHSDSTILLRILKKYLDNKFLYLDAHFQNMNKPQHFVVLDELKEIEDTPNIFIAIHDFNNGIFGGLNYGGRQLTFEVLVESLLRVNQEFKFYTNIRTDIITLDNFTNNYPFINFTNDIKETIEFVHSRGFFGANRGILYAIPKELDLNGFPELEKI